MIHTIGCCDSGIGGMLVADALHKAYPNLDIVYIADQSNVPYGDKTNEQLYHYTSAMFDAFKKMQIEHVIVACNTLCAAVVDDLKIAYPDLNIYSIIEPTCNQLKDHGYNKIGVLATNKTIETHAYLKELNLACPDAKVLEVRAPKLVPIIENGCDMELLGAAVNEYCQENVDAWILGCTHFSLVRPILEGRADLYDSRKAVIQLFENEELNGEGKLTVYTSGNPESMKTSIRQLLNEEYEVNSITL